MHFIKVSITLFFGGRSPPQSVIAENVSKWVGEWGLLAC